MTIHNAIGEWKRKQAIERQHIDRYESQLAEAVDPGVEEWLRGRIGHHRNEHAMYERLIQEQLEKFGCVSPGGSAIPEG